MAEIIPPSGGAASRAAERVKSDWAQTIPASDYTFKLIDPSATMKAERVLYWANRFRAHNRRLRDSKKISSELFTVASRLVDAGAIWQPKWRGSDEIARAAAVAVWDELGFRSMYRELLQEGTEAARAAAAKMASRAALYNYAYTAASVISGHDAYSKLKAAAAKIANANLRARELEKRAKAALPPDKMRQFETDMAPIRSDFARAADIVAKTGLSEQEAGLTQGLGAYTAAVVIALAIAATALAYLADRIVERFTSIEAKYERTIEDAMKAKLNAISANADAAKATIEQEKKDSVAAINKSSDEQLKIYYEEFMLNLISEDEFIKRTEATETKRKAQISKLESEANARIREIESGRTRQEMAVREEARRQIDEARRTRPKTGLAGLTEALTMAGYAAAIGGIAYIVYMGSKLLPKRST